MATFYCTRSVSRPLFSTSPLPSCSLHQRYVAETVQGELACRSVPVPLPEHRFHPNTEEEPRTTDDHRTHPEHLQFWPPPRKHVPRYPRPRFLPLSNKQLGRFAEQMPPPKLCQPSAGSDLIGCHSAVLDADGRLYTWGVGAAAGHGSLKPVPLPR